MNRLMREQYATSRKQFERCRKSYSDVCCSLADAIQSTTKQFEDSSSVAITVLWRYPDDLSVLLRATQMKRIAQVKELLVAAAKKRGQTLRKSLMKCGLGWKFNR
jgi:hypothetical protein